MSARACQCQHSNSVDYKLSFAATWQSHLADAADTQVKAALMLRSLSWRHDVSVARNAASTSPCLHQAVVWRPALIQPALLLLW